jgi:hypothetical protein
VGLEAELARVGDGAASNSNAADTTAAGLATAASPGEYTG